MLVAAEIIGFSPRGARDANDVWNGWVGELGYEEIFVWSIETIETGEGLVYVEVDAGDPICVGRRYERIVLHEVGPNKAVEYTYFFCKVYLLVTFNHRSYSTYLPSPHLQIYAALQPS